MSEDRGQRALADALGANGIAVENVSSIGNAEQWMPDLELAAAILGEHGVYWPTGLNEYRELLERLLKVETAARLLDKGRAVGTIMATGGYLDALELLRAALATDGAETEPSWAGLLRAFHDIKTMEGSDGHSWVRRDSVSALIQGLPDPATDGAET